MKRYDICGTYDAMYNVDTEITEDPLGEWCVWEDVDQLRAENTRLRSALKRIKDMDGSSFAEAYAKCVDSAREALEGK